MVWFQVCTRCFLSEKAKRGARPDSWIIEQWRSLIEESLQLLQSTQQLSQFQQLQSAAAAGVENYWEVRGSPELCCITLCRWPIRIWLLLLRKNFSHLNFRGKKHIKHYFVREVVTKYQFQIGLTESIWSLSVPGPRGDWGQQTGGGQSMFPFQSSHSGDKMHKLKSSQKSICREFITLTQTGILNIHLFIWDFFCFSAPSVSPLVVTLFSFFCLSSSLAF